MESLLVYSGFVLVALGCACVIRPMRRLRIHTRERGAVVLMTGILVSGVGFLLPARGFHVTNPHTRLDDFLPTYQFAEVHSIQIRAPRERVYRALTSVSAQEIFLFRTLTWIRSPRFPWRTSRESILAPSPQEPILAVALRSSFVLLAENKEREIVVGTIVCCGRGNVRDAEAFARLGDPGYAKAAMNFVLTDEGEGVTRLTTETRVFATDTSTERRFATYWRVIYPGSALIRRMWLRAVKARAEGLSRSP